MFMTGVLCTVYGAQVYFIKVVVNKSKAYWYNAFTKNITFRYNAAILFFHC